MDDYHLLKQLQWCFFLFLHSDSGIVVLYVLKVILYYIAGLQVLLAIIY